LKEIEKYISIFFAQKGFSFNGQNLNPLWVAYKNGALNAFEALLKLPDTNLNALEPDTNKHLFPLLLVNHKNRKGFFQAFYEAFKIRHPDSELLKSNHHITEDDAKKILTLGSGGQRAKNLESAAVISYGIFLGAITLPFAAVGGIGFIESGMEHLSGKKLELLAADDERFQIFVHLNNGNKTGADLAFEKHKVFFNSILKTQKFLSYLKFEAEPSRSEIYLDFFKSKGMLHMSKLPNGDYKVIIRNV